MRTLIECELAVRGILFVTIEMIQDTGGQGLLIDDEIVSLVVQFGEDAEMEERFDPVAGANRLGLKNVVLSDKKCFPRGRH